MCLVFHPHPLSQANVIRDRRDVPRIRDRDRDHDIHFGEDFLGHPTTPQTTPTGSDHVTPQTTPTSSDNVTNTEATPTTNTNPAQ